MATKKQSSARKKSLARNKTSPKKALSSKKKEKPAGVVTHYYDNIKVAVVKIKSAISVGDKIRITGGEKTDFTQTVASMESEHKKIKRAKPGAEVGIKVKEKTREGYKVYRI